MFNQPAGHVEYGETIIQAALRETMEETGYAVEINSLLGIYTYTPPMFPDRTYFRFCFLAHVTEYFSRRTAGYRYHWTTMDDA